MLRVAIRSLPVLRAPPFPATTLQYTRPLSRAFTNVGQNGNIMAQPVDETTSDTATQMESNDSSVQSAEEPDLPKLTAQEFRIYNSMADHMNYFVRHPFREISRVISLTIQSARKLSTNVEDVVRGLFIWQATSGYVNTSLSQRGPAAMSPPHGTPHDRGTAHLPGPGTEDAEIPKGAAPSHAAQADTQGT